MNRLIARWESRSGKHWVELHASTYGDATTPYKGLSYHYTSPNAWGGIEAGTDDTAVSTLQARIDFGYFQPDAAKTPMKRIALPPLPDVSVENGGTLFTFLPHTQAATEWIERNLTLEPWQWYDGAFVTESRFAADIALGMRMDGLKVT